MRVRRAVLASLAATVLVFFTAQTTASPAGLISIQGNDSGSHLRITVGGNNNIVVNGYMAPGLPDGCRILRPLTSAVCPANDVNQMVITMGPSGDKIEVLDPLPVPLTVYLGKGSDKLIGNNEVDTCYPQGSRRNRCIGGGGDDICITGPRNSDCVGGPGDDYCKHSTGSDGCWGGPGNDVCLMGPGKDGCHGDAGNDRLYEGRGQGKLYGGGGRDYCDGGPGVGRTYTCERGPGK